MLNHGIAQGGPERNTWDEAFTWKESQRTWWWFLKGDTLSKWKESGPSSLLWVHGKCQSLCSALTLLQKLTISPFVAGTGKSVIWCVDPSIFMSPELTVLTSSTIIEDIEKMRKSGRASLTMYYYDFRVQQKKDLCGLLSSVLFQLGDQSDSYYNILSTSIQHTAMVQNPPPTMTSSSV